MTALLAIAIGVTFAAGVWHLLGRDVFRASFGLYILLNALNLLVLAMAATPERAAPLAQLEEPRSDPLVQAMVLTAIVIGFGVSTFVLLVAARLARKRKTLDAEEVRGWSR